MVFAEPNAFLILIFAPLPWLWSRRRPRVGWPTLDGFAGGRAWPARWLRSASDLARGAAIACLAVAMARPQVPGGHVRVAGRGVAIVAALDRSSSMKAPHFGRGAGSTRVEAAKATLARFIAGRDDDLIGVVAFANYPDLVSAPTLDRRFLIEAVRSIRPAGAVDDGTNIGDAIVQGLATLRAVPSGRKVLILLTDGRDAPAVARPVDPFEAAGIARGLNIALHTIAIGRPPGDRSSVAPGPSEGEGVDGPDVEGLRRLAEAGGGRSFLAADADALDRVFAEIDALEPSPVVGTVRTIYEERFAPWAAAALALLAVDVGLGSGRLRRLP